MPVGRSSHLPTSRRARTSRPAFVALVAALVVTTAACSQLTNATGLSTPEIPRPRTAIALSAPPDAIYLVDPVSGRAQTVATTLDSLQAGYATWAPDHARLAFGDGGIRILDPSGRTTELFVRGASVSMPAYSQNGQRLVFGDGVHMWVTRTDLKAPLPAPGPSASANGPTPLELPQTLAPYAFAWVGAKPIAFQGVQLDCGNPERCLTTPTSDIWTIRADGTRLTQVTSTGDAGEPKWAPGGQAILYVRSAARKGFGSQLWTSKPDGTSPHRLVAAKNVVAADWSPDGKRLVVIRSDARAGALEVWVGNADGSHLEQIGDRLPGTDATVDW
jgi:hypothetical protein